MLRPYIGLIVHFLLGSVRPSASQDGWDQAPSPAPSGGSGSPSGLAIAAAGLSIASWFIIPLIGAVGGMVCAKIELKNIAEGSSPQAGQVFAQIGWWAGLANLIFSIVGTCLFVAMWFGLFALIFGGAAISGAAQ